MAVITIVGAGMMGSALAFPARENNNEVRIVGTHLDRDIIDISKKTNRHPKIEKDFPEGISFFQIEDLEKAISGKNCTFSAFVIAAVRAALDELKEQK